MLLFTDLFEQLHLLAERRLVPGHQQAAEAAGHTAEARQLHCTRVQCAWLQILSTFINSVTIVICNSVKILQTHLLTISNQLQLKSVYSQCSVWLLCTVCRYSACR